MSMRIQRNVGPADRIVRVIVGISLIVFAVIGLIPEGWRVVVAAVGVVVAITGAVGFCTLYRLLGLSGAKR
jgi:hypothetical protein